jgi:DNA polymerase-3 subunit epsilon
MSKRSKPPKSKALSEVRFVVFDSETTGLDLSTNRLLSIAGVGVTGLEVQLDDTLTDGLPEDEAAARFLAFAGDAVLVAHHAAFDMRMLQKAIAPHRGAKVWNASVDTAQLAKRVEVGPMTSNQARGADPRQAYQLDNLVERYGIDVPERHTAAGDALATALLFQRLLRKAERRGIRTLGDLLAR